MRDHRLTLPATLYTDLCGRTTALTLRELLEAAAGWKCTRVVLSEPEVVDLVPLLRGAGLAVGVSEARYRSVLSTAAKGWSHETVTTNDEDPQGDLYVYVDLAEARMLAAAEAEAEGSSDRFGELLGIPRCCRRAFHRSLPHRGDPLRITAPVGSTPPAHARWNNAVAAYAGFGLLSFAPCSQGCRRAAARAIRAWRLLAALDPSLGQRFLAAHEATYIWSEAHGVHTLTGARLEFNVIRWDGLRSTVDGPLRAHLRESAGLRVRPDATLEADCGGCWSTLPSSLGFVSLFVGGLA